MTDAPLCAVLTGDLIKSRQAGLAAVDQTFTILEDAASTFGTTWALDLRFTRFRGDGWQVVLTEPGLLLDATIYFMARLKASPPKIATRIAIGVGPYDNLGSRDLTDASGSAFFISGDHLADLDRSRMLDLAGLGIGPAQVAIIDFAEWIAAGWTQTQAEAVALSMDLRFKRHEDIATHLGVTRQAVQNRLAGAGLSYFDNALYAMRNHTFNADDTR
jgi:hypothetical protein